MDPRATPEQQLVTEAAEALGGVSRVRDVQRLVLQGEGTQYNLGQDVVPGASGQTFTVTSFTRAIDVPGARARTELTRQPSFAYFQGPAAQQQTLGIDGDIAYNVAPNGAATRVGGAVVDDRRLELLHHPLTAVHAALAEDATLANLRDVQGQSLVDVTTRGVVITLGVDATTKLPSVVSHRADKREPG